MGQHFLLHQRFHVGLLALEYLFHLRALVVGEIQRMQRQSEVRPAHEFVMHGVHALWSPFLRERYAGNQRQR